MIRSLQVLCATSLVVAAIACVDRLPDQDLRILQATPVAKLSVDLLVQEYTTNASDANRRYFGKAIEITGTVGRTQPSTTGTATAFLFMQKAEPEEPALEARLLEARPPRSSPPFSPRPRHTALLR